MSKYATKIDDDVRIVLEASVIAGLELTLPSQLDRKLYEKVNKVLVAAGGKWNRSKKAHVFSMDPRDILDLAKKAGEIIDEAKARQQFFTPEWLAEELCVEAGVISGAKVLEPSAGAGAIAKVAASCGAHIVCVENDPKLVAALREMFLVIEQDFLTVDPVPSFDAVAMNPPFANGQAIDHVTHAAKFLKLGGKLAAVMPCSVETASDKKTVAFRELVAAHGGTIERIADDAFKDAGTSVRTVMVTIPTCTAGR